MTVGEPFVVITWNVHKGLDPRLDAELVQLARDEDPAIIALQEARPLQRVPEGYVGHHGASYRRGILGPAEGVMTLSRVAPMGAFRVRSGERELYVLTPKSAVITSIPLSDGRSICVINVHGLNFDPTGRQLARQLNDLRSMVDHLDGPLIVTGDFNTWNGARLEAAQNLATALDLVEVQPEAPGGKTGHAPTKSIRKAVGLDPKLHLDRLYVRGLAPLSASWCEDCVASDHVPLAARLGW